jgi:hypothetical protein
VNTIDEQSGLSRGYAKISRGTSEKYSIFYRIRADPDAFTSFIENYKSQAVKYLEEKEFTPNVGYWETIFDDVFHVYLEIGIIETQLAIEHLYKEIESTKLFVLLDDQTVEMKYLTLYVLLFHAMPIESYSPEIIQKFKDLREDNFEEIPLFKASVEFLKVQIKATKDKTCEKCQVIQKSDIY